MCILSCLRPLRHQGPPGEGEMVGKPGSELSSPAPYLFKIMRACIVHGSRRRAWLSCTASTVLRATVSGFSGGKRLGNLNTGRDTVGFSWRSRCFCRKSPWLSGLGHPFGFLRRLGIGRLETRLEFSAPFPLLLQTRHELPRASVFH